MSSSNLLDVPVDHTSTRPASLPPPRPSSSSYISISSPTVNFSASKQASGYVSRITIASRLADRPIAFKLKTNAPQRYSVKPVYGLIQPDQSVDIYIRCDSEVHINDKFMVQSMPVSAGQLTITSDYWKSIDGKDARVEYLDCRYNSQRRRISSSYTRKSSVSSRESSPGLVGSGSNDDNNSANHSVSTRRSGMQTARNSVIGTTALRTAAAQAEAKKRLESQQQQKQQRLFMRRVLVLAFIGALVAMWSGWSYFFNTTNTFSTVVVDNTGIVDGERPAVSQAN